MFQVSAHKHQSICQQPNQAQLPLSLQHLALTGNFPSKSYSALTLLTSWDKTSSGPHRGVGPKAPKDAKNCQKNKTAKKKTHFTTCRQAMKEKQEKKTDNIFFIIVRTVQKFWAVPHFFIVTFQAARFSWYIYKQIICLQIFWRSFKINCGIFFFPIIFCPVSDSF